MRISDWSSDVCSSDLFYGGSAAEPASFRYDNGSRIVVGGLDEPQRIMGSEVSIVLIDEAIEVTQRDIDMLRTRLRGAKPTAYPHYRMVLLTNPGVPTHHLRTAEGLRMAYSPHQANPIGRASCRASVCQ